MIKQQLEARPATATVLVAQQATTVQGVVCAEQAGSAAFLFGLRVAEEARGNGIAKQLMVGVVGAPAVQEVCALVLRARDALLMLCPRPQHSLLVVRCCRRPSVSRRRSPRTFGTC